MEEHQLANVVVFLLLVGGAFLVRFVRQNRIWREASVQLWRRRRFSILVLALYAFVALLDSVSWKGGTVAGSDAVARHEARSVLDRAFSDTSEKSYSKPFADVEFTGKAKLRRPGTHVLGTDQLERYTGVHLNKVPFFLGLVPGVAGGVVATLAMCGPSCLLAFGMGHIWERFRYARWRVLIQAGLVPVSVGLIAASALILAQAADVNWVAFALTMVMAVIGYFTRVHPLWIFALAAVAGYVGLV